MNDGPADYSDALRAAREGKSRLLFYPSCGTDCRWVLDLDFDLFVLSDLCMTTGDSHFRFIAEFNRHLDRDIEDLHISGRHCTFRRGPRKKVLLFFEDNSEVLSILEEHGARLASFVGVADGCREGGNKICNNEPPFIERVVALASPKGMTYYTDHTRSGTHDSDRFPGTTDYRVPYDIRNHFIFKSDCGDGGYGKIREYVTRAQEKEAGMLDKAKNSLSRAFSGLDDIWETAKVVAVSLAALAFTMMMMATLMKFPAFKAAHDFLVRHVSLLLLVALGWFLGLGYPLFTRLSHHSKWLWYPALAIYAAGCLLLFGTMAGGVPTEFE